LTPKFIVDECVSVKTKEQFRVKNVKDFVHSIDVIGRGATDEEVFELVKKNKAGLVTFDKRFALSVLQSGYSVILPSGDNSTLIKPIIDKSSKYSDPLTYHILENDQVVRP